MIDGSSLNNIKLSGSDLEATITIIDDGPIEVETYTVSTTRAPVDILWVIDNSSSMGPYQRNIRENLHVFVNALISNAQGSSAVLTTDFKMAIITNSCPIDRVVQSQMSDDEFQKLYGGRMGCEIAHIMMRPTSNYPLTLGSLNSNSKDFFNTFSELINVGTRYATEERAFLQTGDFLQNYSDWVRDDAYLAIIYISDEKEKSDSKTTQEWLNLFNSYKTDSTELDPLLKIYSIIDHLGRNNSGVVEEGRPPARRFIEASRRTGGISTDIGGNFVGDIARDGGSIIQLLTGLCSFKSARGQLHHCKSKWNGRRKRALEL